MFDYEYGLLYKDEKAVIKYKNDLFKFRDIHVRKQLLPTNKIYTLTLMPVGFYCSGECPYCFENIIKQKKELTISFLQEQLLLSLEKMEINRSDLKVRLFGGDPFEHSNLISILECVHKTYDCDFNLQCFIDGYINKSIVYNNIQNFYNLNYIKNILLYFSIDFGSNLRKNKYVTTQQYNENILYVLNMIENLPVLKILNIQLCSDTNLSELYDMIYKHIEKNWIFNIKIVRDEIYAPSIQTIYDFYNLFEKDLIVSKLDTGFIIKNNASKFFESQYGKKYQLDKIDTDVYAINPMMNYYQCLSFFNGLTITPDSIIPCPIGYLKTKNINDNIHPEKKHIDILLNRPTSCMHCDLYATCTHCPVSRKVYNCNKHKYIYEWQKIIVNHMTKYDLWRS